MHEMLINSQRLNGSTYVKVILVILCVIYLNYCLMYFADCFTKFFTMSFTYLRHYYNVWANWSCELFEGISFLGTIIFSMDCGVCLLKLILIFKIVLLPAKWLKCVFNLWHGVFVLIQNTALKFKKSFHYSA